MIVTLVATPSIVAATRTQTDTDAKISQAIALFNDREIQKALVLLRSIGDPAVPAAVQLLHTDIGSHGAPQLLLSGFIASVEGSRANAALLELLTDSSPYLRGVAASTVGKRKLKAAVPRLVDLLDDKEVYLITHATHPQGYGREPDSADVPTLVRDVAIDALRSITGKTLARAETKDRQADAWVRWWKKQHARN
jgi:HEAT repeat protein